MATYNHEQKSLFVSRSTAERIIEDEEPMVELLLEYVDRDDTVNRTERLKYYVVDDDLITVSESDDEFVASISGRTAYGTGEYTIRKSVGSFIQNERRYGEGLSIRVSEVDVPFDIGVRIPQVIER